MAKRRKALLMLSLASVLGGWAMGGCGSTQAPGPGTPTGDNGGGGPAPDAVLALLPEAQRTATYVGNDVCATCHGAAARTRQAPEKDIAEFRASAHGQAQVGCEQCHGPGSNHINGPASDNILGVPSILNHQVCSACHSETTAQYAESAHASVVEVVEEAVEEPTARRDCLTCHSSLYALEMVDQPHSQGKSAADVTAAITALTADQIKEMAEHTTSSATCGNCHDVHSLTGNTDPEGHDHQLRQAMTRRNPGEVPPLATAQADFRMFDHGCAKCHMGGSSRTANNTDQALRSGSSRPNMHDNPQYYLLMGRGGVERNATSDDETEADLAAHSKLPGQCSTCHMPNGDHRMHVDYGVSCAPCHSASQAESLAHNQAEETTQRLGALLARFEAWASANVGDAASWDYTSLIPAGHPRPPAADLPIELLRARHNYYLVVRDLSLGVHNPGYTDELLDVAEAQMTALGIPARGVGRSRSELDAAIREARERANAADVHEL
ncbi:MAG: hypothetical protein HUU35_12540 [Armatimonadetes bacterium]|nr:hypothetical protein [Armatimonadota bacterium]